MNTFGSIIAAELQEFSVDLLEPGISPAIHINKSRTSSSTIRSTVQNSMRLSKLVPLLLRELTLDSDGNDTEFVSSRSPKRAIASRAPQDFALVGERLVPTRWNQMIAAPQRPEVALRWLLYILREQLSNHRHAHSRLQKYVGDATASLKGLSSHAEDNLRMLSHALSDCESALIGLRKTISLAENASPSRIKPSGSLPVPFPQEPSWQIFRRLSKVICNPASSIVAYIGEVCDTPILSADLPYLYQRWVVLKLLQSIKRVGWNIIGDPVGAIWLGGKVQLYKDEKRITAWIEPRLTSMRFGLHPSGYYAKNGAEKTPDFLIVAHRESGDEVFVLDATMSKDPDRLDEKGKYLRDIESSSFRIVAGVPLKRFPLRSWAASPILDSNCRISDEFGNIGVIPMNPNAWNSSPLDAWVSDLIALV